MAPFIKYLNNNKAIHVFIFKFLIYLTRCLIFCEFFQFRNYGKSTICKLKLHVIFVHYHLPNLYMCDIRVPCVSTSKFYLIYLCVVYVSQQVNFVYKNNCMWVNNKRVHSDLGNLLFELHPRWVRLRAGNFFFFNYSKKENTQKFLSIYFKS